MITFAQFLTRFTADALAEITANTDLEASFALWKEAIHNLTRLPLEEQEACDIRAYAGTIIFSDCAMPAGTVISTCKTLFDLVGTRVQELAREAEESKKER